MIDTSELRLGNIILFNGKPVKVRGIHTNTLLLDGVMRPAANDRELNTILFRPGKTAYNRCHYPIFC